MAKGDKKFNKRSDVEAFFNRLKLTTAVLKNNFLVEMVETENGPKFKKSGDKVEDLANNEGRDPIIYMLSTNLSTEDKEKIILEAAKSDLLINGVSAIEHFIKAGVQVDGKGPLVWAVENKKLVAGVDPVMYAVQNNLMIQNMDPLKYAVLHGATIQIAGTNAAKDPILYALESWAQQKTKIDSMHPLEFYFKNFNDMKVDAATVIDAAKKSNIPEKEILLYAIKSGNMKAFDAAREYTNSPAVIKGAIKDGALHDLVDAYRKEKNPKAKEQIKSVFEQVQIHALEARGHDAKRPHLDMNSPFGKLMNNTNVNTLARKIENMGGDKFAKGGLTSDKMMVSYTIDVLAKAADLSDKLLERENHKTPVKDALNKLGNFIKQVVTFGHAGITNSMMKGAAEHVKGTREGLRNAEQVAEREENLKNINKKIGKQKDELNKALDHYENDKSEGVKKTYHDALKSRAKNDASKKQIETKLDKAKFTVQPSTKERATPKTFEAKAKAGTEATGKGR